MTGLFRFVMTILLMFSLATIVSCGDGASSNLASQDNTGDGSGDDDSTDNGTATSTDFSVNITNYDGTFLVTEDGVFGETCSISSTSTSNEDVECIFDVMEQDAYVREIDITYNVPAGMCEFVTVLPSWHFNSSFGEGPSAISISRTDGEILDEGEEDECLVYEDNLADYTNCGDAEEVRLNEGRGGLECVYNQGSEPGRGNCCYGDYTSTVVDISSGSTVTSNSESEWGDDDFSDCIGGAVGGAAWGQFDAETGLPINLIQANDSDGINDSIELASNAANYAVGFNYNANFHETAATSTDIHSHRGYFNATTSIEPYPYAMIDDLDGSDMSEWDDDTRVPWVIRCEDSGGEVIHQMKVYIREWNTLEDFTAYNTSGGASADYDPHVTGTEGVNCPYDPFDGNEGCNDYGDFQDIVNSATGGSYDFNNRTATERDGWFPNFEF